jgi:hypothetical protein
MRSVKYVVLPPTGPGEFEEEKDSVSFLFNLPYFFYMGYVPPLKVANIYLATGLEDTGMSGGRKWEPFEIDSSEHEDVLEIIRTKMQHSGEPYDESLLNIEPDSKRAWHSKVLEKKYGMPFEKHLKMCLRVDALERISEEASKTQDEEVKIKTHLEWYHAANELVEFEDQYINGDQ